MAKRAAKQPKIWFEVYKIADISTAYIEKDDLDLLESAPNHLAEVNGQNNTEAYGSIYWTPMDDWEGYEKAAKEHGLSERFISIMRELVAQKIPYVRFDADGCDVTGLDRCESHSQ